LAALLIRLRQAGHAGNCGYYVDFDLLKRVEFHALAVDVISALQDDAYKNRNAIAQEQNAVMRSISQNKLAPVFTLFLHPIHYNLLQF